VYAGADSAGRCVQSIVIAAAAREAVARVESAGPAERGEVSDIVFYAPSSSAIYL
jgi:hypothetical protein